MGHTLSDLGFHVAEANPKVRMIPCGARPQSGGIGHKKKDWQECEAACVAFDPARSGGAPFGGLPCNVWTWCSQPVCFEPDAHSHSFGDCWLKFSEMPEAPEVNQRTPNMRAAFMRRHRKQMVNGTTWHSGALLAPGVTFTNGTWGPRAYW